MVSDSPKLGSSYKASYMFNKKKDLLFHLLSVTNGVEQAPCFNSTTFPRSFNDNMN